MYYDIVYPDVKESENTLGLRPQWQEVSRQINTKMQNQE